MMAARLPKPEAEYRFHPGRNWSFDYAWPEFRIAFEVEGGSFGQAIHVGVGAWTTRRYKGAGGEWEKRRVQLAPGAVVRVGGRHNQGGGFEGDVEKYNAAAIRGWMVIRGTTKMIADGLAITMLEEAFRAKGFKSENACNG